MFMRQGPNNTVNKRKVQVALGKARLQRVPPGLAREELMPLLFLADDSETQVRSYYQRGDLFVLRDDDGVGVVIGMTLAIAQPDGAVELKSVAVEPQHHDLRIGRRMIALVLDELRAAGVRRVIVGTSSSGIGQLAFYQKTGFRLWRIERDYFTAERGYPQGIEENGISLRDMVWMDQEL
jgi:ribosomal protein S18 acetylase RimI-like enzyme